MIPRLENSLLPTTLRGGSKIASSFDHRVNARPPVEPAGRTAPISLTAIAGGQRRYDWPKYPDRATRSAPSVGTDRNVRNEMCQNGPYYMNGGGSADSGLRCHGTRAGPLT